LVIPTKNGGELFAQVVDALKQQRGWDHVEFIIIDSGSTDDTCAIAAGAGARIFRIAPDEFNHGTARDFGISMATNEFIILMVQDAIPHDKYMLERLVEVLSREQVGGVYARQIPRRSADIITRRNLDSWLTGRLESETRSLSCLDWYEALSPMKKYFFCNFDNVCSGIRKSAWEQESFGKIAFGEDIDWAERILKRGYKITYEPAAAVVHSHQRSVWYEYKRTYICHRKLYRQFGLHLVPSLKGIFKSWSHCTGKDIMYIFKNEKRHFQAIKMSFKMIITNFLSAIGQYKAAQDEMHGIKKKIKGV
jgi:glycosyltransferase involved in cell wall biosynthesis